MKNILKEVIRRIHKRSVFDIRCKKDNNGWILTEDQLPEEPVDGLEDMENLPEYIVVIEGATQSTMLYYAGDGEWYRDDAFYKVIAWQPFPEWK